MDNTTNLFEGKVTHLKEARLELLRLHKILVDIEREHFEKANGRITSGQFLNLLLNDESLQWLRKFSTLIVNIDEMLDLDDGFTEEMIDRHLLEMLNIIKAATADEAFNEKYRSYLEKNPLVENKNNQLKTRLSKE